MNYADKLGIPYVVFLGEDEIAAGVVACKDMASGEQTNAPLRRDTGPDSGRSRREERGQGHRGVIEEPQ